MTEREIKRYTKLGYHFQDVYSIFVHHFGEDKVDIQDVPQNINTPDQEFNVHILVYFPKVKVTNENNKSIIIYDLFARVTVNANGRLENQFELTRSTFTREQFRSGYVHSHLPSYTYCMWHTSCLGSGPIGHTYSRLLVQYDECTWMLFCRELDEYVHVESLRGGPYIRLESVGGYDPVSFNLTFRRNTHNFPNTLYISGDDIFRSKVLEFTHYLLENCHYKFCWNNGEYKLAYSPLDFAFLVTKYFTDFLRITGYHNKDFLDKGFVRKYILKEGNLYEVYRYHCRNTDEAQYVGRPVCSFKGCTYTFCITESDTSETEDNEVFVLSKDFLEFIYQLIINIINYTYGKKLNQGTTVI